MTDLPDPDSPDYLAQRKKVIRQRNVATALVLGFFVILFFAITIAKMNH
jgi:hypothetical protein